MQDEQELLAAARSFDESALAQIHRMFYQPLYHYVAFRVGDPHTAEDLTSEVFARLLTALHNGKAPRTTLRGWLYGVAAHMVSDHYRRQGKRQTVELNEAVPTTDTGPFETVERQLARESLAEALNQLTEDQQTVIALRYGSGFSIREVADTLGKSEGAIKQLQARAIATLARLMTPENNR